MTTPNKLTLKQLCTMKHSVGFHSTLYRNIGFAISLNCFIHIENDKESDVENFFRAAMGALVGSVLTQPLDYIKTQLQMTNPKYHTSKEVIMNTLRKSPVHFYTGTFSRSVMGFMNMGIGYYVFRNMYSIFNET